MMRLVMLSVVSLSVMFCEADTSSGYTLSETNALVAAMLRMVCTGSDNLDQPRWGWDGSSPQKFFRLPVHGMGDWSPVAKQAAFDVFLDEMWRFDFANATNEYRAVAVHAVAQCASMNYTNALPFIKRLVLNETYPSQYRIRAIESAVEMTPINEEATVFVESVFTNRQEYSRSERAVASGLYIGKLLASQTNGVYNSAVLGDLVDRLYRHRQLDLAGGGMLDRLFVAGIDGYWCSSNRLDYALFILGQPDCNSYERRAFSAITNQLLSSGQPLRQLTIGAGAGGGE